MNSSAKIFHFAAEGYLKTACDLFIDQGDYHGALQMVENAIKEYPGLIRALVLQGDILYCLDRDVEALASFEEALKLNPDCVEALVSSAGIYESLGRYRQALSCCQQAFKVIQPHQAYLLPVLYEQQIILLLALKKYSQARLELHKSGKHLPAYEYRMLLEAYGHVIDQFSRSRRQAHKDAMAEPMRKLNLI